MKYIFYNNGLQYKVINKKEQEMMEMFLKLCKNYESQILSYLDNKHYEIIAQKINKQDFHFTLDERIYFIYLIEKIGNIICNEKYGNNCLYDGNEKYYDNSALHFISAIQDYLENNFEPKICSKKDIIKNNKREREDTNLDDYMDEIIKRNRVSYDD